MTPKEKALELVSKYMMVDTHDEDHFIIRQQRGKKCALIAVDEVIEFMEADDFDSDTCYWANHSQMKYWTEVKQEIEKL
jgi:hypothetical protein